jgi:hypothetical protein
MTANMGSVDRAIRYLLVLVIIVLLLMRKVHGALAIVLIVVGAILLITAFLQVCPLYSAMKVSTKKKAG